jgi:hypothetical protein
MKNKYESLNSTFDTDFAEIEVTNDENEMTLSDCKIETNNKNQLSDDELKSDYKYSRANLYSIIEKGQEALNGILELAQESDQPRAYEVAGQLIKSVSDATEKLLDLQKKIKDLEDDKKSSKNQTNVTNNALFIGSTAELSKFLKSQTKD